MRPGDKYPRAVEIAEQRYEKAKRLYKMGVLNSRPRRKDFVPPYKLGAFEEKWWKLIPSLPSWTITAHLAKDCYSHIHYDSQKRAITVREAARLQSFPDAFIFSGHTGDCFRQIGNAVPPLLSYAVAKHLKKLLTKKVH
jgi:DNA (cytosine-5)-methyltransferase 1